MIKHLENSQINRAKYDDCVKKDSSNLVYPMSFYLDLVCENWEVLVLGDYEAVMPLPTRKKYGVKYFYRPFGIQQLGVFSLRELEHKDISAFQKKLIGSCRYADICFNENQSLASLKNTKVVKASNLTLSLDGSYQKVYEQYSKNLKRKLKKAQRLKWEIQENGSPELLVSLFKEGKGKQLELVDEFYKSMQKIMYAGVHHGWGKLWIAYSERNEACAGIFMIEHNGRCILLFSASNEAGKEGAAMARLVDEYIILNTEKKKLLDFEGSNDQGLARFYGSFGAKPQTYYQLVYNNLPFFIRWLK